MVACNLIKYIFKCNNLILKMFSLVKSGYRAEVVRILGAHFILHLRNIGRQQTLSPHYFLSLPLPDISRFNLPGTLFGLMILVKITF